MLLSQMPLRQMLLEEMLQGQMPPGLKLLPYQILIGQITLRKSLQGLMLVE